MGVRETAAASVQALKDAQAQGRLTPNPPVVRPAPPELRAPPPTPAAATPAPAEAPAPASSPPPAPAKSAPASAPAQAAARRNSEEHRATEAQLRQQEELRKSEEDSLQMEQQELHEALLRSMADAWSADEIILSRLTFHSPDVMSYLLESPDLATCHSRVKSAGCSERPAWSNGALLLVPMTQQQIVEAGIYLEAHNILMLA